MDQYVSSALFIGEDFPLADAPSVLSLLRRALGVIRPGVAVDHSTNPDDALPTMQSNRYQLCFVNSGMAPSDRNSLVAKSRAGDCLATIVLLTDGLDLEDISAAIESGVSDYILFDTLTSEKLTLELQRVIARHQIEMRRHERLRIDKLITAMSMQFTSVEPAGLSQAFRSALFSLCDFLGSMHAAVILSDENRQSYQLAFEFSRKENHSDFPRLRTIPAHDLIWLDDLTAKMGAIIISGESNQQARGLLQGLDMSRAIAVPVRSIRQYGVLILGLGPSEVHVSPEILRLLSIVGEIFAGALRQREVQEQLRNSEVRYRTLIEGLGEGILFSDRDDVILQVNSRMAEITGYSREELIGQVSYKLLMPEQEAHLLRQRTLRRLTGLSENYEIIMRRKDGTHFWAEISATPIRDSSGEIIGTLGAITDISERKKAESSLLFQQEFLREVIDTVPNLIFVKDAELRFTLVNKAFAGMYGLDPSEIIGKTDHEIHPVASEADVFAEQCKKVLETGETMVVTEDLMREPLTSKDIWFHTIRRPLRAPDGSNQVLSVVMDITERKLAEAQSIALERKLLQSQKMEAIGQLAAGVAHDLNNALGAVVGHLQLMGRDDSDLTDNARASVRIALVGCERALSLINQLLGFSRQGRYNLTRTRLISVAEETVSFLSKVIGKDITIQFEPDQENLFVTIDIAQVQQALTNLIINSKQAMPKGGTIWFRLQKEQFRDPSRFNAAAKPGDYAVLSIADSGAGIPPEHINKVFEPFFTTKGDGTGSGLGLPMVYGIMQNHGGWVDVESVLGKGSTFRLFFPLSSQIEAAPPPKSKATGHAVNGQGKVMVIDDEEVLVDLTRRFLELGGLTAVGFTRGLEAVDWYKEHWRDVDLIVLDMKMPGIDGPKCYSEIREINPAAKVVVLSGFVQDAAAHDLLKRGALRFFQKPLKYPELVRWIVEHLNSGQ